ncbi:MAG: hypothetical protein ACJAY5_001391 [Actinomycetes bacterium]|jgi:hypothetical protein
MGLVNEVIGLLDQSDDDQTEQADPLAAELGLTGLDGPTVERPQDPVLLRLLPDGYRDDREKSAEFRRFTDEPLRQAKLADAAALKIGLALPVDEDEDTIEVSFPEAEQWLRAINDLRLSLGVQLGIADDPNLDMSKLKQDDPLFASAMMYDFLTWWQDSLLIALIGDD